MTTAPLVRARGRSRAKLAAGLDVIDAHIGLRVKLRRTLAGLSQSALAERVGVTFQQVQKYENGATSISAARLWQLANALDVPVSFFFDGLPGPGRGGELDPPPPEFDRRETLELVKCYYRLTHPAVRHRLFDLLKATVSALEAGDTPHTGG